MKKSLALLFAASLVFALPGCDDDDDNPAKTVNIPEADQNVTFENDVQSKEVVFKAAEAWTAAVDEVVTKAADWIEITPMSGEAGDAKITITATSDNTGDADRKAEVVITAGKGVPGKITIVQKPVSEQPSNKISKIEIDKGEALFDYPFTYDDQGRLASIGDLYTFTYGDDEQAVKDGTDPANFALTVNEQFEGSEGEEGEMVNFKFTGTYNYDIKGRCAVSMAADEAWFTNGNQTDSQKTDFIYSYNAYRNLGLSYITVNDGESEFDLNVTWNEGNIVSIKEAAATGEPEAKTGDTTLELTYSDQANDCEGFNLWGYIVGLYADYDYAVDMVDLRGLRCANLPSQIKGDDYTLNFTYTSDSEGNVTKIDVADADSPEDNFSINITY